mmetsp:Transcript_11035/g.27861  ORF Transcript_11035/g.27861 Transcript_11035/m.27861 type:complete len:309 (+) Transcript_11035:372-1298(+)
MAFRFSADACPNLATKSHRSAATPLLHPHVRPPEQPLAKHHQGHGRIASPLRQGPLHLPLWGAGGDEGRPVLGHHLAELLVELPVQVGPDFAAHQGAELEVEGVVHLAGVAREPVRRQPGGAIGPEGKEILMHLGVHQLCLGRQPLSWASVAHVSAHLEETGLHLHLPAKQRGRVVHQALQPEVFDDLEGKPLFGCGDGLPVLVLQESRQGAEPRVGKQGVLRVGPKQDGDVGCQHRAFRRYLGHVEPVNRRHEQGPGASVQHLLHGDLAQRPKVDRLQLQLERVRLQLGHRPSSPGRTPGADTAPGF